MPRKLPAAHINECVDEIIKMLKTDLGVDISNNVIARTKVFYHCTELVCAVINESKPTNKKIKT